MEQMETALFNKTDTFVRFFDLFGDALLYVPVFYLIGVGGHKAP